MDIHWNTLSIFVSVFLLRRGVDRNAGHGGKAGCSSRRIYYDEGLLAGRLVDRTGKIRNKGNTQEQSP